MKYSMRNRVKQEKRSGYPYELPDRIKSYEKIRKVSTDMRGIGSLIPRARGMWYSPGDFNQIEGYCSTNDSTDTNRICTILSELNPC